VVGASLPIFCLASAVYAETLSKTRGPEPVLEILVYNYAQVPGPELAQAEEEAARIFRHVGLKVEWSDYPFNQINVEQDRTPGQGPRPTHLALRLLPRAMADRLSLGPYSFGFALPAGETEFGSLASVFYHRAEDLAACRVPGRSQTVGQFLTLRMPARAMILGHLMAHEIGHLLLGVNSHATKGIMQTPWSSVTLKRAAFGKLHFNPQQAKKMRTQVRQRLRAAQATQKP